MFQHAESEQQTKDGIKSVEELLLSRPTHTGEYRQLVPVKQVTLNFCFSEHSAYDLGLYIFNKNKSTAEACL